MGQMSVDILGVGVRASLLV